MHGLELRAVYCMSESGLFRFSSHFLCMALVDVRRGYTVGIVGN